MPTHHGQPFPLSKLAFWYVKHLSSPIASHVSAKARKNPKFAKIFVIPPAQLYHFYETKIKLRILNLGRSVTSLPKMDESKAISLGSQLVSEFALLSVASAIAFNEYRKFKLREQEKDDEVEQFFVKKHSELDAMILQAQVEKNALEQIEKSIQRLRILADENMDTQDT